jgi:methionine-rich copper-binding protein CopC
MRLARTGARIAAALVLLLPAAAYAHDVLRKSEPANGATLRAVPRVIRLTFSQPPQLVFTRVELLGPDSQRVALSPLRIAAPDSARVVLADVAGPLSAGRYRIQWQITSADGHPVRGTVVFEIAALPPIPAGAGVEGERGVAINQRRLPPTRGSTRSYAFSHSALSSRSSARSRSP